MTGPTSPHADGFVRSENRLIYFLQAPFPGRDSQTKSIRKFLGTLLEEFGFANSLDCVSSLAWRCNCIVSTSHDGVLHLDSFVVVVLCGKQNGDLYVSPEVVAAPPWGQRACTFLYLG